MSTSGDVAVGADEAEEDLGVLLISVPIPLFVEELELPEAGVIVTKLESKTSSPEDGILQITDLLVTGVM